jgi:hypothetical protein
MMTITGGEAVAALYEHAMPAAPPGSGVAPPTVEAEGHAPVLIAAALVAGAEVGAVVPVAAAALELDVLDEPEDDDVVAEVPQAASAATANSPVRSDGRVMRWDMGMRTPFLKD